MLTRETKIQDTNSIWRSSSSMQAMQRSSTSARYPPAQASVPRVAGTHAFVQLPSATWYVLQWGGALYQSSHLPPAAGALRPETSSSIPPRRSIEFGLSRPSSFDSYPALAIRLFTARPDFLFQPAIASRLATLASPLNPTATWTDLWRCTHQLARLFPATPNDPNASASASN